MTRKKSFLSAAGFMVILLIASGVVMGKIKEPIYTLKESINTIEIRSYAPVVKAQIILGGPYKEAIHEGFMALTDYIYGNNKSKKPDREKIQMMAPVLQQQSGHSWLVSFIMPDTYTLESLPKPANSHITLTAEPERTYVIIQFSGLAQEDSLKTHLDRLTQFIADHNLKVTGQPLYAFYNSPWTLPILRRNEIMIEIM